jgi:hypothetical protein
VHAAKEECQNKKPENLADVSRNNELSRAELTRVILGPARLDRRYIEALDLVSE